MARGGRAGVYAVARGRAVGVFDTWAEAEAMVVGYQGARFKKFGSPADARAFVAANAAQRQAGAGRSVRPAPAAGGIGRY
ncbi:Ribonuclease H, partial [Diplonema papillatum]